MRRFYSPALVVFVIGGAVLPLADGLSITVIATVFVIVVAIYYIVCKSKGRVGHAGAFWFFGLLFCLSRYLCCLGWFLRYAFKV